MAGGGAPPVNGLTAPLCSLARTRRCGRRRRWHGHGGRAAGVDVHNRSRGRRGHGNEDEGVVRGGVRPDADQRGHGECSDELRAPEAFGGRTPQGRRGRSCLAHGNAVHKAISEEPSHAFRAPGARRCPFGLMRASGPLSPGRNPAHAVQGPGQFSESAHRRAPTARTVTVRRSGPRATAGLGFFRPASIWQASEPLLTRREGSQPA
jgi:hypothetical protein